MARLGGGGLDESNLSGTLTNEYIFFGGARIARRDPSSNVFYYFSDHLGTARSIAEVPSGQTTATKCYDADLYPFGGERWYTDSCDSHFKFTGKERDPESGLDDFGARYNSSTLGRFMSPDDAKFSEKTDPQSWNLYSYVGNNPLSTIDPTGHNWFFFNGQWQWYPGDQHTFKDSKGVSHKLTSNYTNLIVYQETGHSQDGATTYGTVTLYGNNGGFTKDNIMAQDNIAFSGGRGGLPSIQLGNYEINLNRRGGPETEHMNPADLTLTPFHKGIQQLGIFQQDGASYSAYDEWGNYRASLIPLQGQSADDYLHGKGFFFSRNLMMTQGCVATPYENVLKTLWGLDPNGVGEGSKNGRIAVWIKGQ